MLAAMVPDRVDRLVVLSVGCPGTFAAPTIEQRERSWYVLFFQFERVAEEQLARDGWKLFREWCRHDPELQHWIPDLSRPGALTAALNWYRANVHPTATAATDAAALPPVRVPVLGVWGTDDAYLTEEQMMRSAPLVAAPWRYERIDSSTSRSG